MTGRHASGARLVVPVSVAVIGLALIGLGQGLPNRHSIEGDLTDRSTQALSTAGLTGLDVSFTGRDGTITGAGSADVARRAEATVLAVDGVRVVSADLTAAAGADPGTTVPPSAEPSTSSEPSTTEPSDTAEPSATASPGKPVAIGFTLAGGTITVTGTTSSDEDRDAVLAAAKAAGSGWTVVDKMVVDDSLDGSPPPIGKLPAVTKMLAKAPVDGDKLVVVYPADRVIMRGTPPDAKTEQALLKAAQKTVAKGSEVMDGMDVR